MNAMTEKELETVKEMIERGLEIEDTTNANMITLWRFYSSGRYVMDCCERDEYETLLEDLKKYTIF